MKRVLPILLVLLLLAGCETSNTSPAVLSPSPAIPSASVTSAPAAETEPIAPTDIEPTEEPAPEPTPRPTLTPVLQPGSSGFPKLTNNQPLPALPEGAVAVSDGKAYFYSGIYRLDPATGKSKKVTKTDGSILSMYLDGQENLYYYCWMLDPDMNSMNYISEIYKYDGAKTVKAADRVSSVVHADANGFYYLDYDGAVQKYDLKTGKINVVAQLEEGIDRILDIGSLKARPVGFYAYAYQEDDYEDYQVFSIDLAGGTVCSILGANEKYKLSDDGACLVAYKQSKSGVVFTVYDYAALKKTSCTLPVPLQSVDCLLVADGHLYVTDDNDAESEEYLSESNIYDIDMRTNTLVSTATTDYIDSSRYYEGKWYLYTYILTNKQDDPARITNQEIQVFDPAGDSLIPIAELGDMETVNDNSHEFEIQGRYIWLYNYCGIEGGEYTFLKRIPIPPEYLAATPSPAPSPSPAATAEPEQEPPPGESAGASPDASAPDAGQ
jgi:outer membrane protein assembly factor BamB